MRSLKNTFLSILFLIPLIASAQMSIKGKVVDKNSQSPLPGVNVVVKGTTNGAVTDFDGIYMISKVNADDVLIFSFVGYNTLEIPVSSDADINVELVESAESLEEIVLIGYGTTTVKDATGSVAAISEKDFNQGNIVTPASLITGRVAGVNVTTDGSPGGGSAIRIRGGSSLNASNDPLIVIDGLPIDNNGVGGSRSILSTLNPNDIESFSVLKDASSTAIYGSRAANGVIIIKTKQGKQNFQAEYGVKVGYQTLADKIDIFTADEFRSIIAERVAAGQSGISVDQLGTANTDWQDEIYNENLTMDHSFSLSGLMFENMPARLSLNFTSQPGLRKTSMFERSTTSLALNPKFFDEHLKINFNATLALEKNRFAEGVEGAALIMDPTQPVYDLDSPFGGYFEYYNLDGNEIPQPMNAPRNPVANLRQRDNRGFVNRLYGNIEFDYKLHFFPDLRAVVNLGYDKSNGKGYDNRPIESINGWRPNINSNFQGSKSEYTSDRKNLLFDGYLVYNKEMDDIDVEVTGGYSYQKFQQENFNTNNILDPDDAAPDVETRPDIVLIGFFGRTNLSFFDKYLLTLSYRRDGTSRFSKDNRWGNFPAAALAWKIKDEDFLSEVDAISTLKLRLGWGITGQQDIGDAANIYLGKFRTGSSVSQYIFGNEVVFVGIPQYRNEEIKWEETTTYNVGLDFGFGNDRVSGSVDAYLKNSEDLLAYVAQADGSNFSNAGWQNIGNFISKGIEFAVSTDIIKKDDLNWNVSYNANFNDTKIDKLIQGQDLETGGISGGTGSRIQVHREDYAPFSFFVYKQLYDASGNPIEGAYVDINQDGIINPSDRYIYKKPSADITMGLQSNLNYKKFDFSFNLRASLGNYMYNNVNSSRAQYNLLQATEALGNMPTSVLESGFEETSNVLISDYYIENASFLKMDNLIVGYTFDKFKKESTNIRLWGGVQNVFTVTNYSGLDPEIFGGIDNTIYPRPRTFLIGANIKF